MQARQGCDRDCPRVAGRKGVCSDWYVSRIGLVQSESGTGVLHGSLAGSRPLMAGHDILSSWTEGWEPLCQHPS